jgi:hypothetical protein
MLISFNFLNIILFDFININFFKSLYFKVFNILKGVIPNKSFSSKFAKFSIKHNIIFLKFSSTNLSYIKQTK